MLIRIGLLLDSFQVSSWQKDIIDFIRSNDSLQIVLVVTNASRKKTSGRLVYRLLRKADRLVFKTPHDHFKIQDVEAAVSSIPQRQVLPLQTTYKDQFQPDDIAWINDHKPDILIRFGFRILTGSILTVAPHGVWSLHHGDSAVNRGGPPAFWEVVNGEPITGVTLQILSETLDAGKILGKAYGKTNATSFNRNQQAVYAAGIELFCAKLHEFGAKGPLLFFASLPQFSQSFAKTLYRDPENGKALRIACLFWWRRAKDLLQKLLFIRQWVIYYHRHADSPFNFTQATQLAAPNKADWADPFVFHYQDADYLFFEYMERGGRGEIKCLRMDQLTATPTSVLKEPHHVSYPTITRYQEQLYLLVESGAAKEVALYACEEFPNRWKKLKPLLTNIELYDPTLHWHDGCWYLFGTHRSVPGASTDMNLHIYCSTDLLQGSWVAHPMNPITRDVRGSRPAGLIFQQHGKLVRPTQIGAPYYGSGMRFFEIKKLTPTEYEEEALHDFYPWQANMIAAHTYSTSNGWYVIDAQIKR